MELSIQERLKDLRVERGLTLEQLEEQVNLSIISSLKRRSARSAFG